VKSNETADWLVQELTYHYQALSAAYERSQRLQNLVRPFLPAATWTEAADQVKHGGETLPCQTHEASILRLDIADFTELMDSQPLDLLLADLNTYLDILTRLVYDNRGEVSKYLGDGFLVIFASADRAVQAGCALQQAAADFNRRQVAQNRPLFSTRIGIDSGPVALVSLGSPGRQDRTIMGMPVNLAERLQAQATPGQVWLSQATFERLQDQAGCRRVGPVVVYEKYF
jgi:adenylate cyclase